MPKATILRGCRVGDGLRTLLATWLIAAAGACGGGGPGSAEAAVEREVIGDTVVLRVRGAGEWGDTARLVEELRIGMLDGPEEHTFGRVQNVAVDRGGNIYVLDAQSDAVRVFGPDGTYLRDVGRPGQGPGELSNPSGMAFLPDGRLLVRDFGNDRISIFGSDGEPLGGWPIPGSFATGDPLQVDSAGNVYTTVIAERSADGAFRTALMRFDSAGAVLDTVFEPHWDHPVPRLVAVRQTEDSRSMSSTSVPFLPEPVAALTPRGDFAASPGDRYSITFLTDPPLLRVEREVTPVPVDPEERETAIERVTEDMRETQPDWRWDAPDPPTVKPPITSLRVAEDGRLWVTVATPSVRTSPPPDAPAGTPDRWIAPPLYDVFEPDGTYLGPLVPTGRLEVMRGEHVWSVVQDELGVQYVVRFRIQPGAPG